VTWNCSVVPLYSTEVAFIIQHLHSCKIIYGKQLQGKWRTMSVINQLTEYFRLSGSLGGPLYTCAADMLDVFPPYNEKFDEWNPSWFQMWHIMVQGPICHRSTTETEVKPAHVSSLRKSACGHIWNGVFPFIFVVTTELFWGKTQMVPIPTIHLQFTSWNVQVKQQQLWLTV